MHPPTFRSHLTLALTTLLHLFTHAYGVVLVPLYLLVAADLHLPGVKSAALIVTVYGVTYCLFSYNAGVLADRLDRKWLLGFGLLGNALAIAAMGFTHQYALLLALSVAGGLFGTLFHPTANALIPAHYPRSPGMAIGLLGVGSGLGFYVGPRFAGWRAETAHWLPGHFASWQRPLIEIGLAGVIVAICYLLLATEARTPQIGQKSRPRPPLGRTLRRRMVLIACTLGCRDFAGVASVSLAAVYLQKALKLDVRQTGAILGAMMLLCIVVNPLLVYLSPRRRRLPTLTALLLLGGVALAAVPFVHGPTATLVMLGCFQTCQLGSYAVSDAAMLERTPDPLRGRVVGLFLLIAGTTAALSPWVVGFWTDALAVRASIVSAYVPIFATFGVMMACAASAIPFLHTLGPVQGTVVEAVSETMPATLEVVG